MEQSVTPVIQMRGVTKRFPGVLANDRVDFDLRKGEIHALLGENGAGKSTLMNVLYGLYERDKGEILVQGSPVQFESAREAIAHGLGMVHQHFMLIPPFSVAENMILGQPSSRGPLLEDPQKVNSLLLSLSKQYGLSIEPEAKVWTLSVGQQQRVEILKSLYRGAEVLILDEPTAVLTPQEVKELLGIIKKLTEEGKSIVFISHKLDEVLNCSDRITVLRDGKVIDTVRTSTTNKQQLARMMVGRDVVLRVEKKPVDRKEVRLRIRDLYAENDRGLPALNGVDLEVHSGEILGLAGVAGNGQSELEEALTGLRKAARGNIMVADQEVVNRNPDEIIECGVAHIPSDRYYRGLLKDFTVAENMVLQRIGEYPYTKKNRLDRQAIREEAVHLAREFNVRTPSVDTLAGKLSGGNAQKMILAREIACQPEVLIAAQPTRGLDVSAIEYVHQRLLEQRERGVAILLISQELEEILTLSDRIAVIYEGKIVDIMEADQADVEEIGLMMTGSSGTGRKKEENE